MYTDAETEYLRQHYPAKSVEELAEIMERSTRSIIGKLSRMGIYQKKQYVNKRGERPVTKLELSAQIAHAIGVQPEELEGLEKAPKETLRTILGAVGKDEVEKSKTASGAGTVDDI